MPWLTGLPAIVSVLLAFAAAAPAAAQEAKAVPPLRSGPVEWIEPSAAEVHPQTDAEKNAGMVSGRTLPRPELLRPSLDRDLLPYVPTRGLTLNASLRAGSSDVLPGLVEAWTAAFRKYHPDFHLTIERPLAGSLGALELIKGNLDLVFVSRELKPSDIAGFHDKFGYDPFSVPISGGTWRHFGFLDAVVMMVNPANPVTHLSFRQLDAAFSTTRWRGGKEAKTWGDLGVGGEWAAKPIHLYGIKPWNGFEEFVRQRVLSTPEHRGEWSSAMAYDETFFNLARRVAADPYALGYTGLSAVDSQVKLLPVSADETGPALAPDYQNVAAATYPLSRVLYLNANPRSAAFKTPAMHEFLRFVLSREGQAVVRDQGIYLPLRAGQVTASIAYVGRY